MPRAKAVGQLKRPKPFLLRFNEREKRELEIRAGEAHLSMVEYCRRKVFDVPFSVVEPRNGAEKEPIAQAKG